MHIYNTDGDSITQQHQLTVSGEVTTVSYSPNGEKLAASGYAKTTHVFETSAYKVWNYYGLSKKSIVLLNHNYCNHRKTHA